MTAPDIQQQISDLILDGKRLLVADLEEAGFVSSAGLRVFLTAQKQLKKVDGEIILYKISDSVFNVFKTSGFDKIIRIASSRQEIDSVIDSNRGSSLIVSKEIDGISIKYMGRKSAPGSLIVVGSQENLSLSQYTQSDVTTVKQKDFQFGTGLATIGDQYEEYKNYFGESMIINRNFYFYPAVKHPAVDFMLCADQESSLEYKFLHGFGFKGSYKYVLTFESSDRFVTLEKLVSTLFKISQANTLGIVLLAESKGLWAMHLKKVPISENRPQNGREIFDAANFSDWINFPVEPGNTNNIIAGTGIAVKHKSRQRQKVQKLLSEESHFHIHAGVFSKGPLSKTIERFEDELSRVLTELDVYRVQHILGQSLFSSGMAGIIEFRVQRNKQRLR